MQYALLVLMAFAVMAADNKTGRTIIISLQAALLLTYTYFQNMPALVKPIPAYKHCIIVTCVLFAFVCVLEYFKGRQLNYRQNLAAANDELLTSNKTKERMLSILSHDFNTPVRNLSSSLHLLDENVLTQQQFQDVSLKLQAQLQVLTTSLEDVLQWSKLQAGGDTIPPSQINISSVIADILPMFQYTVQQKNISLHNNVTQTITACINEGHLKLILRNLLSNAIKFSHSGGNIFFDAECGDGKTTIKVIDEGTGMPQAILDALQNEQLNFTSSPGTAKEKGTGLGLLLVREFLYKNNGTLAIKSALGKGSTFSIILPAAEPL
jgi:signal transduction histidine kinase